MGEAYKVLIVDDSATMRAMIGAALRTEPRLQVVGEAADPLQAREAIRALSPDVLTLDVEMPRMNGLEFLERLMRLRPMPVVMVSTLTERGADATLAALELGAVDCIAKPTGLTPDRFRGLAATVLAAAQARPRTRRPLPQVAAGYQPRGSLVAIGASTGGVEALLTVIGGFPANCPPTVVTQHMPASFTASFAARLDRVCAPRVSEARDGDPLEIGRVYIAPGGEAHLEIERRGGRLVCRLVEGDLTSGHRPSVDRLFGSVAEVAGPAAAGALLTGMGRDGAEGLLRMRRAGAQTIAQDETTSVVFGMPRVAWELGAVQQQLPLEAIAGAVLSATGKTVQGAA
ncbi:MAG: chemotaxis response regulator protein-glutamate methylesterase [Brevundimonas sp.]|uniref:protein-glutamate methylesterase/protein-glutamine glutaminase n=1 Tax=Brevundimonas sp. TaxID=1871086 RepID=UPI0018090E6B|nr:chemotaxis response regulator protein-glutamate methylesterase [Brevundimonas sp.]MBA4803346.1 chemotaxis response regulator protein-glutamate methylesterase [Brevundimonas sp.]